MQHIYVFAAINYYGKKDTKTLKQQMLRSCCWYYRVVASGLNWTWFDSFALPLWTEDVIQYLYAFTGIFFWWILLNKSDSLVIKFSSIQSGSSLSQCFVLVYFTLNKFLMLLSLEIFFYLSSTFWIQVIKTCEYNPPSRNVLLFSWYSLIKSMVYLHFFYTFEQSI